jgi:hypothetical protein
MEPNERSLQRVASELAKGIPLVKRWSARWEWVERASDWDSYQELRRLGRRIEAKQRMDEQHLKIIEAAKTKLVHALAKDDPEELSHNFAQMMNWMTELTRLERLIREEPESIEERCEKIQVETTFEEQLKVYTPAFQELFRRGRDPFGWPDGPASCREPGRRRGRWG